MRMTHDRKVETYKQAMAVRGVGESTAAPPLWNLLWSCGLHVPPPPFMSFVSLFMLTGALFGPLFAAGALIIGNRGLRTMSLGEAGVLALIAGAVFGLAMASYYRHLGHKHRLGSWSAFTASRVRT